MAFERKLSEEIIAKLTQEQLYSKCLLPDIKDGNVFPAIRKDKITFYYKGGSLFSYDGDGFKTNIKFASVFKISGAKDEIYINEQDLSNVEKINDFIEGYDRIKENCALYSGVEAIGVSEVCRKYSYFEDDNEIVHF